MKGVVYIGDKLKQVRLRRAMTQRQLAEAAGMTHRSIVRLEKNRTEPHPTTLRKLADALRIDPAELLGE